MSIKTIHIVVPFDAKIPEIIHNFSPDENVLMLKIGSDCLKEGRNAIAGLTQKEIYNNIKSEYKDEIKKMELDILVERELSKKTEEKIKNIYGLCSDYLI